MASQTRPLPWPAGYDELFRRPFSPTDWKGKTNQYRARLTVDEFTSQAVKSAQSSQPIDCNICREKLSKSQDTTDNSAHFVLLTLLGSGPISSAENKKAIQKSQQAASRDEFLKSAFLLAQQASDEWEKELQCNAEEERDPEDFRESTSPNDMEISSPTSPVESSRYFKPLQEEI